MWGMVVMVCALPLALALLFTCLEASARAGSMPSRSRVAQAIARDLGLELDQAGGIDLQLLIPGLRLSDDVGLRVADVRSGGRPDLWLLRLECDARTQCLPFEVALRSSSSAAPKTPNSAKEAGTGRPSQPGTAVVRPGQKVMLAEDAYGMHLSAPGICLQTGSLGERIRVRNAISGRVVLARVKDSGNLMVER